MNVHPSGYYAWKAEPASPRRKDDLRLQGLIKQSWLESGGVYGYRKIAHDLRDLGEHCGKHRVYRLMKQEGLRAQVGMWQCYIHGVSRKTDGTSPSVLSPLGRHFVDLEQALIEPTWAWNQDEMAKCADLLESSEVLAPYLWPDVVSRLRRATTEAEITTARAMVMLEIYLSCLACWDAQVQAKGHTKQILFESLFPDFSAERIEHPNALFFIWLADYSRVKERLVDNLHSISKPAADTDIGSTKRQLRRWKRGKGFASEDMLDALFRNLYGDRAGRSDDNRHKDWIVSWSMAMATRRISFVMPILFPLRTCRDPLFPFGHQTVQEWRVNRYPHWYEHWLPRLKDNQIQSAAHLQPDNGA